MSKSKLLSELHDLNMVCSDCPSNHDTDVCNNCPTLFRLSIIRSILNNLEEDDYYLGLESWDLKDFVLIYAEDANSACSTFCEDYLSEDYEPARDGDIVLYKHSLPQTATK